MKLNLVILFSVAVLAASGYSQNSGGSGGTAGGTTAPGQPTGPTTPGAGGTPPPTLNPGIGENSLQIRNRTQPATPPGQVISSETAITNSVTSGTNQFAVTNLSPTSQSGFTNRVMATNGSLLLRDQAISETDRQLLTQIRTSVFGTSQASAMGGTTVHFILREGAVRIVGAVPNADEQNRIVTTVQKIPGVVRVYDALQVGGSTTPAQTPAPTQAPAPGQTPVPGQPQ
jgi:osmotically-inducible protein OsmY